MYYEIDEIRKVKLGGVIQKIHIRGSVLGSERHRRFLLGREG